ncbi:gamma carbonic anhydrase family protein [Cohnella ginsengisoli]|uniref:Gamma carbonic anhydrase family protein n=1 Tax=Cohnella ginsengisoli TaxID=425004 RepID=A0A9X4KIU0_9BACL|nr:gamma carbonic anhydrase family protein [Cohnella ginsengisoli]MDG0790937.1 gamma carbonic anhydrase family protein [Cohnella ginsengisoli]
MATIQPFGGKRPDIHESAFLAAGSVVTGDVKIGKDTSIWYNAVIRGDVAPTVIGERTSIQDNSTLHQSPGKPLIIEDEVIVGHNAVLHSCVVRRGAMVGMGALVLDGAEIGEGAMVGAGALVPPGKKVAPRTLVVGSPAKPLREVNEADEADMRRIVREYVEKGRFYKKQAELEQK